MSSCGLCSSNPTPPPSRWALHRALKPGFAEVANVDYRTVLTVDAARLCLSEFKSDIVNKRENPDTEADFLCRLQSLRHTTIQLNEEIPKFPDNYTVQRNKPHSCTTQMCTVTFFLRMGTFETSPWCQLHLCKLSKSSRATVFVATKLQGYIRARTWPFRRAKMK